MKQKISLRPGVFALLLMLGVLLFGAAPLMTSALEVSWPPVPTPDGMVSLEDLTGEDGTLTLGALLVFFYGLSLWISGILAFVSLIYVGVIYILSGDNPGTRALALARVRALAAGILIIFLAVMILNIIDPGLKNITLGGPNSLGEEPVLKNIELIGGKID